MKNEKGLQGLMEGDKVPACFLGNDDSDRVDEFEIKLPDVSDRKCAVDKEIDNLGVFKLSYLETLVRIADRRASVLRETKT